MTLPSASSTADGLIGVDPLVGAGDGDLAAVPGLALVIAVDGGGDGWAMGVAARAGGEPDGDEEAAGFELDTVVGAGGEDFPGIGFVEVFEGAGDLHRCAPGDAVIGATHVEAAHVFHAEEAMDRAIAIRDEHRVIVSDVVGIDAFDGEREWVLGDRAGDFGDALWLAPGFAIVRGAAEEDADVIPIAAFFSGFAPGQDRALGGDHDAGDVIDLVTSLAGVEEIDLFEERLGGEEGCRWQEEGGDEGAEEGTHGRNLG